MRFIFWGFSLAFIFAFSSLLASLLPIHAIDPDNQSWVTWATRVHPVTCETGICPKLDYPLYRIFPARSLIAPLQHQAIARTALQIASVALYLDELGLERMALDLEDLEGTVLVRVRLAVRCRTA